MKLYIIGSVASGKTTLAKKIAMKSSIPCTHLDGLVHIKDRSDKVWGNRRRPDEEINEIFTNLIDKEKWVIEDAGRIMFSEGLSRADQILYLKPPKIVRQQRIITRYIKQKLGFEDSIYRPSYRMLKFLYQALKNYETGKDDLDERVKNYKHKTMVLRSKKQIDRFLESL